MFYWWIWHPGNDWNDWEVKVFLENEPNVSKVFKFKGVEQVYDFSNLIHLKDKRILSEQLSTIFYSEESSVEIYYLLFEQSNAAWWLQSMEYATQNGEALANDLEQFGLFLGNCLDDGTQACLLAHKSSLQAIDKDGQQPSLMEAWTITKPNAPPPADYSISFINWSKGTFKLYGWALDYSNIWDVILQLPSDSMPPGVTQTLSWYIREAGTILMPTDYHFGWMILSIQGKWQPYFFGIGIEAPVQFWGIGKAPPILGD
ncbi:hypothetical protein N7530_011447 [Penicillium desertorum]|uniref:Uncharacterized protein n=1 Tax=Penicillium desertorum TaxID=1303715 RepID=A0A9W9WDW2_9EURO|nr:hypothetical protein N7530_011447 [Penicillium desertorum]